MNDFGELSRYRAANQALKPPSAGEQRVIFFGDSITDGWHLDQFFPGKGYINRGIGGQTTSQMLLRFRQDVIDLQPHVLIILAGTNDVAGNTGPISIEDIERNYATMAELARVHHIVTIFSSVTPVNGDVPEKRELFDTRPAAEINALNAWLKQYCAANGDIYLDYYGAMVDERGEMRDALSADGLHPNEAGYKIMAPLAQSAIDKALQM
jgi:lysophospholipase L1-like esterase